MNWTEPRKSQKFSQQGFSACRKIQTTCLNTPIAEKDSKTFKNQVKTMTQQTTPIRNCPYHFNIQDHVCLNCRKSICVRCAITYCQGHLIKQQKDVIPTLLQDLYRIYFKQKVDEIQTKLGQSLQRQEYFQNRSLKLKERIEENFEIVIETLKQKKQRIIQYFDQQFHHYFSQYHNYDLILKKKLVWLNQVQKQWFSKIESIQFQQYSIQNIDELTFNVKDSSQIQIEQKKLSNLFLAKSSFTIDKLWSQENLEKILYQIQNIPYKLKDQTSFQQVKYIEKKKRFIDKSLQCSDQQNKSKQKSPLMKNLKASARILLNKFGSARKSQQERLQKSQLL